jgi:hypothetical protein
MMDIEAVLFCFMSLSVHAVYLQEIRKVLGPRTNSHKHADVPLASFCSKAPVTEEANNDIAIRHKNVTASHKF